MRERVLARGASSLADYELLEMLLFYGIARRDTKPLAKALINTFGSFEKVLEAPLSELSGKNLSDETLMALKLPGVIADRLADAEEKIHPQLSSWDALLTYFDTALQGSVPGQLRILFLDNKNRLLGDEAVPDDNPGEKRRGPRIEAAAILRRALRLHATALIGVRIGKADSSPAKLVLEDAPLGAELKRAGELLSVVVHDIFAVEGGDWASLKQTGRL